MSEPIIEIIGPCEHGFGFEEYHCEHGPQGENGHGAMCPTATWCDAGSRVRYTRQEAIDLLAKASYEDRGWELPWDSPTLDKVFPSINQQQPIRSSFQNHAKALVDALLGETDV